MRIQMRIRNAVLSKDTGVLKEPKNGNYVVGEQLKSAYLISG